MYGAPAMSRAHTLAEIIFEERKHALPQKQKPNTRSLAFVTQYRSSVPNLKHILMQNWHYIQQQQLLRRVFKDPPLSRTEGVFLWSLIFQQITRELRFSWEYVTPSQKVHPHATPAHALFISMLIVPQRGCQEQVRPRLFKTKLDVFQYRCG